MKRLRFLAAILIALATLLTTALGLAFEPPPLHGHVVDTAAVLTQEEVLRLDRKLERARKQTGFAIVVFIPASLENEPMEDVAYKTFNTWKIGSDKGDDGVLLVIAPNEKKTRIESGKGVGGALTDVQSSHINRETINPLLKQGLYYEAANRGTDRILHELTTGTAGGKSEPGMGKAKTGKPPPTGPLGAISNLVKISVVVGVIVLIIILAIVSPTFREILFWVLLFGRFGGGGGSSGGGGRDSGSGYGGGGGSSGGGGSTDDW